MLGNVTETTDPMVTRIVDDTSEYFLVRAFLVTHHQNAQRAAVDQASGEGRVRADNEDIERVAVGAHRTGNPAIIERIEER